MLARARDSAINRVPIDVSADGVVVSGSRP